ncbi:MAG: HD domain-containing protein, partial [Pyrinomonadaceae bacterium]|nr:HD domain-containing protein [Phycisphaerales bacterium]
ASDERQAAGAPESDLAFVTGESMRGIMGLSISTGLLVLLVTLLASFRLMRRHDQQVDVINAGLEAEVKARVAKATATRDALIRGLAKLADYRDSDTGTHLDRIAAYSRVLAESVRSAYPQIDDAWIQRLVVASSLHDIGKVGIPDEVLLKPGSFTPQERERMQQHPVIGADTLITVRELMGNDELLEMSVRVTLYHHERWDGTGYPMRVAGAEIPLEARIVAVADVYDALTSRRVYKAAFPHAKVVEIIRENRGTQFDPVLVGGFLSSESKFNEVRKQLQPPTPG